MARTRAKLETEEAAGRETERASTTDPDVRLMKMADGGFRPAWNVRLSLLGPPGAPLSSAETRSVTSRTKCSAAREDAKSGGFAPVPGNE